MIEHKDGDTIITVPLVPLVLACFVLAGSSMFFVGKRVGQEEALRIIRPVTCVLRMADMPVVHLQTSTDKDTSKLINDAVNLNISGRSSMPTTEELHKWQPDTKFVIGRDGQWEQRPGQCTAADFNCMD
jgi:hypothetical protein